MSASSSSCASSSSLSSQPDWEKKPLLQKALSEDPGIPPNERINNGSQ